MAPSPAHEEEWDVQAGMAPQRIVPSALSMQRHSVSLEEHSTLASQFEPTAQILGAPGVMTKGRKFSASGAAAWATCW